MQIQNDEELSLLFARLEDIQARTQRGEAGHTRFLTPREARRGAEHLRFCGGGDSFFFYGGYPDAERGCLFFLPEYLSGIEGIRTDPALYFETVGEENPLCPLRVRGSGYRALTHRDYLGSLLSLGIEREVIGDILLLSEHESILFCLSHMADFLCTSFTKVGGDTVRTEKAVLPDNFTALRRTQPINDTVASARLDCIVAALCNLSRENAQNAIRGGTVEVEYEPQERVDLLLEAPCILSVRGIGKFRLLEIGTQTRKGRYRLLGEKFI